MSIRHKLSSSGHQRGSVAIEFALAFPLFFTLFYAIVGYGLVMTMEQSLTEATKEGARRALRVDPIAYASTAEYQAQVTSDARATVAAVLQWLPAAQKTAIIGTDNGKIGVSYPTSTTVRITLTYTYAEAPLLPILTLPVIGKVPNVPDTLVVTADGLL